jgi:putative acetyltransferase
MFTLRNYADTDAAELLDLYRQTIRTVNCRDYNPEQIAAWSSDAIELEPWRARFKGRFAYVVELQQQIVGFADMDTNCYLDRLFVSAAHQRQGIAKLLLLQLIADAQETGIATLTTEASITAKPFFESFGFKVQQQQTVQCRGAWLINYRMQRDLDS